jgi:hypothetical protein
MTVAGHLTKVYARADNGAVNDPDDLLDGVDKVDLQRMVNLLETTDFKDTSGARTRIPGLADCSLSVSGDEEAEDPVQDVLRNSLGVSSVFVTVLTNPLGTSGKQGWKVEFYVEKEAPASAVDSKVTTSFDLKATGAATRV